MKYEKRKKITDVCQFKKGRKYISKGGNLFEFSHVGKTGNPYFKDEGQNFIAIESEYNCFGFNLEGGWYEALEVTDTLDDKITELVELGRSKGLKINITIE